MESINTQFDVLMTQTVFPPHFLLWVVIIMATIVLLGNALFAYSVYKTGRLVAKANRRFPLWLVLFFIFPFINIIFQLLLLVFDIPRGLKRTFSQNRIVVQKADGLFSLGLVFLIVTLLAWVLNGLMSLTLSLVSLILLAVYWVKIVRIRQYCHSTTL